jgi:hypothetical protein
MVQFQPRAELIFQAPSYLRKKAGSNGLRCRRRALIMEIGGAKEKSQGTGG